MTNNTTTEYLVTAQGYENNDEYKQTLLLHDYFLVENENKAKQAFREKFNSTHTIVRIYSATKIV